jgi:predicted GNAT family N-acyltransferase
MTAPTLSIRVVTNKSEWQSAKCVRQEVFVEEQSCPPEEEWDAHDAASRHLIGNVNTETVATARWREVEHDGHVMAKLERFAVREPFRGRGYGREMVHAAIADAQAAGHSRFVLHAQAHLEDFYGSFGFTSTGHRFDEVGIPHVEMIRGSDSD